MLKTKLLAVAAAAMALTCTSLPASADSLDEVRLGIFDHDSNLFATRHENNNLDINAEALFKSPSWLAWAWAPRPHVGATVNTGSGTSLAYAGLTWDYNLTEALFIEGSFGGAIHNGELEGSHKDRRSYGCRFNFHENASIGYRFDARNSLMLTVEHMSNASLCDANQGLTNIGLRYGYSF